MTRGPRYLGLAAAAALLVIAGCTSSGGGRSAPAAAESAEPLPSTAADSSVGATIQNPFPIGTWTSTITEADLRAAGITGPGELTENAGTFTTSFLPDGTWTTVQKTPAAIRWPVFKGTWATNGPATIRETTTFPPDYAGDVVDVTWELDGDELHLAVPNPPDPIIGVLTAAHPWRRSP